MVLKTMKWRELAIYFYIQMLFKDQKEVDYYDLLYTINMMAGKKNSRRIIRRLLKEGLIEKNNNKYRIIDNNDFLSRKVLPYIATRIKRRLRNIDPDVEVSISNSSIVIHCKRIECKETIEKYLKLIPNLRPHIFLQEFSP